MNFDFKKITKAWFDSYFGTKEQKELATLRLGICEVCPSRKVISENVQLFTICDECGCPIKKKIFSSDFNDCPLSKWESIDSPYFPPRKEIKTLF